MRNKKNLKCVAGLLVINENYLSYHNTMIKNVWCGSWIWAVWCVLAAANCEAGPKACDITIGDQSYEEEIIVTDVWLPHSLVINYSAQTMYFNYYNGSWYNAKVDLESKAFSVIEELSGWCCFTVDQGRGQVHAGCRTTGGAPGGLYHWNSKNGSFELTGAAHRDIKFIYHYNNTLYYSLYYDHLLRTFLNGRGALVPALPSQVDDLVIDRHGDTIFRNWTGVYRLRVDSTVPMRFEEFSNEVNSLAVDNRGAAYTCNPQNLRHLRGIWRLHDRELASTKLLDVPCIGLTFDIDDNIIYADSIRSRIIRLVKCQRPLATV